MIARAFIVIVLIGAAGLAGARTAAQDATILHEPLVSLPLDLGSWRGREARPFPDDVVTLLGVDDYVHRIYVSEAGAPINVYAGYYRSQRQGDTIHSPQNCLPGAGWQPIESDTVTLAGPGGDVRVNRYVIQKGIERQVVLYWYQGRGRTVASEYTNKALLMWDAATRQRTNGGLVRVMSPVLPHTDASREVTAFATALLPHLQRVMP